jgi:hypothetical protein
MNLVSAFMYSKRLTDICLAVPTSSSVSYYNYILFDNIDCPGKKSNGREKIGKSMRQISCAGTI